MDPGMSFEAEQRLKITRNAFGTNGTLFLLVTRAFRAVEQTKKRTLILDVLTNMFAWL